MARYFGYRPYFFPAPNVKSLGDASILLDNLMCGVVETTSVDSLEENGSPVEPRIYEAFKSYPNDDVIMKSVHSKSVPDRILSAMITRTLFVAETEGLELTSRDIHDYISTNEFYFESPETDQYGRPKFSGDYSYDNLPALRRSLVYCRHAGYISKHGSGRPYTFQLTTEGRLYSQDPFFKYNLKMQYMQKLVDEIVSRTLSNDENVKSLAESLRLEMCKTCRLNNPKSKRLAALRNTVRPNKGRIGIQRKDGTVMDVEVTEDGQIKELEDLKDAVIMKAGSPDIAATITTLQNENEGLKKVLTEAGFRLDKSLTQLEKEKGRKGKLDAKRLFRNMTRMEVAHAYYEAGMYLDGEFFDVWGGDQVVVEYKRLLEIDGILNVYYDVQGRKGEIMTRTDYARRILEPAEIPGIGIYVAEIRGGSIVVDSEHFQAPKTLTV